MSNKTTMEAWEVKGHFSQIGDTGDYDGHYELTNGKVSLFTKDDVDPEDESVKSLIKALDDCGFEFYLDDADKVNLFISESRIKELETQIEQLKKVYENK